MQRTRLIILVPMLFVVLLLSLVAPGQDVKADAKGYSKAKIAQLTAAAKQFFAEKKFDEAIAAYREIILLDPTDAYAYGNLGAALGNTRRPAEAVEVLQTAIKLDPTNAAWMANLGSSYMDLRRWDESLAAIEQAIKLDPTRGQTYNLLGFLFDNTHRLEEALAAHKKSVELDPKNAANFHNLGLEYMKLGRPADAVGPLETALSIAPNYKNARYHLSNAYSALRRYKDAVESFTKLIELDPDSDQVIVLRAWNYMYLGGSGKEAAGDAERYLKLYGWRTDSGPFQAIIAILGYRSAAMDDKAAAIIAQAYKKAAPGIWPFKIIRFLDGQMTADELLAAASTTDQRTEAHTYIGLDLRQKNKPAEARQHFEWVKEYGNRTYYEYPLALAELERSR